MFLTVVLFSCLWSVPLLDAVKISGISTDEITVAKDSLRLVPEDLAVKTKFAGTEGNAIQEDNTEHLAVRGGVLSCLTGDKSKTNQVGTSQQLFRPGSFRNDQEGNPQPVQSIVSQTPNRRPPPQQ